MSDLSKEIREHSKTWPPHLKKRINCQRLLAAAAEIEALEAKIEEMKHDKPNGAVDQFP